MFSISLYYCHTENNRMYKDNYMDLIATLMGSFRESVSILSPVITIELTEQIIQNLLEEELIVVDEDDTEIRVSGNYSARDIIIKYRKRVLSANYVYIPEFNRYYFVDDIIAITDKLWQLNCSVDVLMSFKEQLGELDVFCERNEYNYNDLLIDEKVPSNNNEIITYYGSTTAFNDFEEENFVTFILSTSGYKSNSNYIPSKYTNKISVPYIHYYVIGIDGIFSLQKELFLASSSLTTILNSYLVNPSDCIRSITAFPFNATFFAKSDVITDKIICSDREISLKDENNNPINVQDITTRKVRVFTLMIGCTHYYNNFLDYEPYTKLELMIPFLGKIDLPTDICMGNNIYVSYYIDCETGMASVKVYINRNDSGPSELILFTGDCQIGYSIPIIKTNLSDQVRGITSALIGLIGGAVVGGAGGVALSAQGMSSLAKNTASIIEGEMGGQSASSRDALLMERNAIQKSTKMKKFSTIGNYISSNSVDLINSLKGGISSGASGSNSLTNNKSLNELRLIIRRPNAYYPTDYNHLVGRPSKFTGKLKNIKGYTELSGFHLEGLYNCTREEQNEINSILRSGFLMPDP